MQLSAESLSAWKSQQLAFDYQVGVAKKTMDVARQNGEQMLELMQQSPAASASGSVRTPSGGLDAYA